MAWDCWNCLRIASGLLRDCFGSLSKRLAAVLERLWNRSGPSWTILEASWSVSGDDFGASRRRLEASWRHPGAWFFKDVKVIKKSMIFNNWRRFVFKGCIKRFNAF